MSTFDQDREQPDLDRLSETVVEELLCDEQGRPVTIWEALDRHSGQVMPPLADRLGPAVRELRLSHDGVRITRYLTRGELAVLAADALE